MSGFLNKLFGSGRSSSSSAPNPQQASEQIAELIDLMQKRQVHLETKIEECVVRARRCGTRNKRQGLSALKEKRRFEKQLEQTDGIITTLEYQREALQNAQSNADILNVMSYAVKAMRNVNTNVDFDKATEMLDDMAEQHDVANEIANAISTPIVAAGAHFDEDELLKELERFEQEELEKQMIKVGPLPQVPSQPTTAEERKKKEDDEDLDQLRLWAS